MVFKAIFLYPFFLKNGSFFGTLCAIDPKPANLKNTKSLEMFNLFADLISFHINAIKELQLAQTNLQEERKISEIA